MLRNNIIRSLAHQINFVGHTSNNDASSSILRLSDWTSSNRIPIDSNANTGDFVVVAITSRTKIKDSSSETFVLEGLDDVETWVDELQSAVPARAVFAGFYNGSDIYWSGNASRPGRALSVIASVFSNVKEGRRESTTQSPSQADGNVRFPTSALTNIGNSRMIVCTGHVDDGSTGSLNLPSGFNDAGQIVTVDGGKPSTTQVAYRVSVGGSVAADCTGETGTPSNRGTTTRIY